MALADAVLGKGSARVRIKEEQLRSLLSDLLPDGSGGRQLGAEGARLAAVFLSLTESGISWGGLEGM